MSEDRPYEGGELEIFAAAYNWKNYWSGKIRTHLGKSVLEVGAGLGTNTPYLLGPSQESWSCLEPDASMSARIPATLADHPQRNKVRTQAGTLRDLAPGEVFDSILYIDVLEHIEDDEGEMRLAFSHLAPGGKIIVLSPAFPQLYTEFDRALGHFRRYTRGSLRACTPHGSRLLQLYSLDCVGLMASVANKLFLHQSVPTPQQIRFWDDWLITTSRLVDPLIGYSVGKSLVGIWLKSG